LIRCEIESVGEEAVLHCQGFCPALMPLIAGAGLGAVHLAVGASEAPTGIPPLNDWLILGIALWVTGALSAVTLVGLRCYFREATDALMAEIDD
jgi:hypothetical protein